MRERILQGPPFSAQEQRDILDYCEDDVRALARLLPHIVPTIRPPLSHAMFRAKFQWAIAQQERRGIPMDGALLARLRNQWQNIRLDLVTELDRPFGCYEVVDGRAHWRKQRFADYVRRHRMSWPTYENGNLDETDQTFREMAGKYPQIEPLRELRYSLSKLRLNDLAVGRDHRNRAPLWAYGTKTGAQCTRRIAVRVRAGQVVTVPDHPATGSRSGAPGLPPARGSHCRGAVRRQCAAAGVRER